MVGVPSRSSVAGSASVEPGVAKINEREQRPMPAAAPAAGRRNRQRDRFAQWSRGHREEQHAGPEHHPSAVCHGVLLQHDREPKERVQAHARRDREAAARRGP